MAPAFGILQLVEYLQHLGVKIAHIDHRQKTVELSFHGEHGQWRMIIGIHHEGDVRKLMLLVPHMGTIGTRKRMECLEALMAVNYRIAIGKFGLDLEEGEVRLEAALPLADDAISFEQFKLAFSALLQTASVYHSLLPRIIYGHLSAEQALKACEDDFFHDSSYPAEHQTTGEMLRLEYATSAGESVIYRSSSSISESPELSVTDVLEEVTRLLRERHD